MEIELNGAKVKVYEDGRIETFQHNKWINRTGTIQIGKKDGYKRHITKIKTKGYTTARIIAFAYLNLDINNKTQIIDHIDRNSLNNNLSNLRIVNSYQNSINKNVKGYYYHSKNNKWVAQIKFNFIQIYLGIYDTKEEALQSYLSAKLQYHII